MSWAINADVMTHVVIDSRTYVSDLFWCKHN